MTEESGTEAARTAARFYEVTRSSPGERRAAGEDLGDGVMLHFPDATAAVRSALEVQTSVA